MDKLLRQVCLVLSMMFCCGYAHSQEISPEYLLKSVNLYKICKFTQWPNDSKSSETFTIMTIGKFRKGEKIDIPEGKKLEEKPVRIIPITEIEEIQHPHVLFICGSEKKRIDTILKYTDGKNILTVGDTEGFSEAGVMINFFIDEDTVHFKINVDAVNNANLKLHSQLYRIGKIMKQSDGKI